MNSGDAALIEDALGNEIAADCDGAGGINNGSDVFRIIVGEVNIEG